MRHPWETLLYKALKKSTEDENLVLGEAEDLRKKGYAVEEIFSVLIRLRDSLVQDKERSIATEAAEEFEKYV